MRREGEARVRGGLDRPGPHGLRLGDFGIDHVLKGLSAERHCLTTCAFDEGQWYAATHLFMHQKSTVDGFPQAVSWLTQYPHVIVLMFICFVTRVTGWCAS